VFSRAVKNYFGIAPEQIKEYPAMERMQLLSLKCTAAADPIKMSSSNATQNFDIRLKKINAVTGIYQIAPCNDAIKICKAFTKVLQIAASTDLLQGQIKMYGIYSPHQGNLYKAFIPTNSKAPATGNIYKTTINAGKYVTYKTSGDIKQAMETGHYLLNTWLPQNGLRMAGIVRFETFSGNPANIGYNELEKEVYIPVEPV
jgi:predicted transcriptional regulator YdeE